MGRVGFEHAPLAPSKPAISSSESAPNYTPRAPDSTPDPDLAQIVAAWPDLPDDVKRNILHLVKSHRPTPGTPG